MEISNFLKNSLLSEISGNVIDLCPVGALTSKPVRLGAGSALRLVPAESHVPERAVVPRPALADLSAGRSAAPLPGARPLHLLPRPTPIEVAVSPGGLPERLCWHRRTHYIDRVEGPERIAPEWWRPQSGAVRDYFRVEDRDGARFWVFRSGAEWFLHGLFA